MANPSMVIRVAATIAELKANLAEGRSQIETTTASMQKMASSLSGDKLIQTAHNITAAVNEIGGASKLTEAEQARVNATLERALDKYRALGREAPPGMQKLADETRQVDKASSGLTDTVKTLAAGFAAMFTARAAFNFVKSTAAEASSLKDLSQQTHINVEELQILAGAMSEFGVDADTLGKGLYTLSRKIAHGDDSIEKALGKMGMSLKEVDGLNGEALFLKIMGGLSKLQGGLRDDTSSEIFGSRLGMAMAGASEGIEGAIATWRKHNTVMSTETVDALDQADEAIKRTNKSLSMMAANLMGPLAEGFNHLFTATQQGAGYFDFLKANALDTFDSMTGLGTGTEHLARLLDQLNQKTAAASQEGKEYTEVVIEETTQHSALARARDASAAAAETAAVSSRIYGDGLPPVIEKEKTLLEVLDEIIATQTPLQTGLKFTSEAIATVGKESAESAAMVKTLSGELMTLEAFKAKQLAGGTFDIKPLTGFALEDVQARFHKAGERNDDKALWRALDQLESMEGKYKPTDNLSFFAMQRDQVLLAQLRLMLSDQERPPGFADGVSNWSGGMAMVGERGPEMVSLPRGSSVTPNHQLGGTTVNVTLNVNGPVAGSMRELAEQLSTEFMRVMRGQGFRNPVGV